MVALIVIALALALIAALVFWPVQTRIGVECVFRRKDFLFVKVSMFGGFIQRSRSMSVVDLPGGWYGVWVTDQKGRRKLYSHLPRPKRLMQRGIRHIMASALKRGSIEALHIRSDLGLPSDAAATAIAAGAFNALTFALLTASFAPGSIPDEHVEIRPRFDRACFIFKGRCIIKFRIEHIIIAGWNDLTSKRKKAITHAGASH